MPRLLSLALSLLAALAGVAAAPIAVRTASLWIDETIRFEVPGVERVLNLTSDLVEVERGDHSVTLRGLAYGEATVRVSSIEGPLLLRVQVKGRRPSIELREQRVANGDDGYFIDTAARQFVHFVRNDTTQREVDVSTVTVEALSRSGPWVITGTAWLEQRGGELEAPNRLLQIQRARPGASQWTLGVGDVAVDWSRFTLPRRRIRGGRFGLATANDPAGRPRLRLEALAGQSLPNAVLLGGRIPPRSNAGPRVGGLQLQWEPRTDLTLWAETGLSESLRAGEPELPKRGLGVLGLRYRHQRFELGLAGANDGESWAANARTSWTSQRTAITLAGEAIPDRFSSLFSAPSRRGRRNWLGSLERRFGQRLRLAATSSYREVDRSAPYGDEEVPLEVACPDPLEQHCRLLYLEARAANEGRSHSLRSDYSFGAARKIRLALSARQIDETTEGVTWDWSEIDLGAELPQWSRGDAHASLGASWQRFSASSGGRLSGSYGWDGLRLTPGFRWGSRLRIQSEALWRYRLEDLAIDADDLLWNARASFKRSAAGWLRQASFHAGYREWDSLSRVDGLFRGGRYLYAEIVLDSRDLGGFAVELRTSWSADLDSNQDGATAMLGIRRSFGGARSLPLPTGHRSVAGVVYSDLDRDGIRDAGEPARRGVTVRLGDGRSIETDASGRYRFRRVAGSEGEVRIEPPAGERAVGGAFRPVISDHRQPLDFGLTPAPGRVEIVAFNDVDGDGVREGDDPLLDGVVVALAPRSERVRSRSSGPVAVEVPADEPLSARLVPSSLPHGYRRDSTSSSTVLPRADTLTRLAVPVRALRTVRGRVFLDANGNQKLDQGEKPVVEAVVEAAGQVAISDDQGRFALRELPAGEVEIALLEGAPPDWVALQIRLELPIEPTAIDDAMLPLLPKSAGPR